MVGVIFSVVHADISHTTRLSSVCVHVVSRLMAAAVIWLNKPKFSVN